MSLEELRRALDGLTDGDPVYITFAKGKESPVEATGRYMRHFEYVVDLSMGNRHNARVAGGTIRLEHVSKVERAQQGELLADKDFKEALDDVDEETPVFVGFNKKGRNVSALAHYKKHDKYRMGMRMGDDKAPVGYGTIDKRQLTRLHKAERGEQIYP